MVLQGQFDGQILAGIYSAREVDMRRSTRIAVLAVGSAALVVAPATAAFSAPNNAPSRLVGTADCGPDGTFDFVVNSGNAQGTTWNPAFLTGSNGQHGLFLPASVDLTFTSPFGTDHFAASKPTCGKSVPSRS